jgi:TRAP-type C4-dicarboxylate transport system permease small subunit
MQYRKIARILLVFAALMAKIFIGVLLMYAGTFFTFYAFTETSIDDLRIGVLGLKFLGISFLVISVGMTLVAVREAIEDLRYI